MGDKQILWPVFGLALWTSLVLLQIPRARFTAAFRREVLADDFKLGESARVPPHVSLPNRNYMNLLEMPQLFHVVCLLLFVTHGANATTVNVAWAYVALRVAHSLVHLSYDNVFHRLTLFALSNLVLGGLWLLAAQHVWALPGT